LFDWLCSYWKDPTWQHGALAFPIAAFLVWRKRKLLPQVPVRPSTFGLVLVLLSLAIYWVGYRGSFFLLGFASIHLLLGSAVLWLWGWQRLRLLSFAWLVVGFAWPYLFLEDTLSFKLRYLMVNTTSWLLNHGGIATAQDGTQLFSAAVDGRSAGQWFDLNVDAPCSGLRSLFALIMAGALFGYFRQRSLWRRSLLFLLGAPLAVLANMMRILILVVSAILFGQDFAIGNAAIHASNYHLLTGFVVFLVAFAGLSLVEKALNRWCGKERPIPMTEENPS
jgi:exosortase